MVKKIFLATAFFVLLSVFSPKAFAVAYDLTAPEGPLHQGDQVQFTVYIDSEGTSVKSGEIGMTYETQYVQYVSTSPGPAMSSVAVTPSGTGKFLLTGTNSSGFTGNDVFAYVTFKIVATAPGSTQLCALWSPVSTPTVAPTAPPGSTSTPGPPQPTALPRTGDSTGFDNISKAGGALMLVAFGLLFFKKILL